MVGFARNRLEQLKTALVAPPETEAMFKEVLYLDLPEMLVNLSSSGGRTKYLKLIVSLETDDLSPIRARRPWC